MMTIAQKQYQEIMVPGFDRNKIEWQYHDGRIVETGCNENYNQESLQVTLYHIFDGQPCKTCPQDLPQIGKGEEEPKPQEQNDCKSIVVGMPLE